MKSFHRETPAGFFHSRNSRSILGSFLVCCSGVTPRLEFMCLAKCLQKIQQVGINLLVVVQATTKVLDSVDQLITGYLFPKAMLLVQEDLSLIQEFHGMAVNDICSMTLEETDVKKTGL